jgi:fructose-specific phosphotransferase system IIC component
VSGGLVVFTAVAAFASWSAFFYFFVLTFYPALFVLMVSSIGAIVGRLLLAARRDEQSAEQAASGQDWFE